MHNIMLENSKDASDNATPYLYQPQGDSIQLFYPRWGFFSQLFL